MSVVGALILSALSGLNPWIVLVIVVGLAVYTDRAPLNPQFTPVGTIAGLAVFGAVMGIEVVVSKLRQAARFLEPVTMAGAAVTGALVPLALVEGAQTWYVLPGLALAVGVRLLRHQTVPALNRWLRPFGHIAASIVADLVAGCLTAAVFAIRP